MRPYQSLLVKIQKGRRAVVVAGLQPKRQILDFRHQTSDGKDRNWTNEINIENCKLQN